jgi:hypothetical protein
MKKIFGFFFFAVMLVTPQVLPIPNATGRIEAAQANVEVMLTGNINVRSAHNGNIVLIIDSGVAGQPDGTPDLIVRFAPKKKKLKYQNLSFDLEAARLFLDDRRVSVIGNDGHVRVSLSLEPVKENDPSFALYGDSSTDIAQTVRIVKGYALHRQTVHRLNDGSLQDIDIEKSIFIKNSQDIRTQDDGGQEGDIGAITCQAGGKGSIQCSYNCGGQSCSVTCAPGSYACCNCGLGGAGTPFCSCISEKKGL